MNIFISDDAEQDIAEGYFYYEKQAIGLGDYFRNCILSDIDSLVFFAGIHEVEYGYHRLLAKTFPFLIYYRIVKEDVTVIAVLDGRSDPTRVRARLS